MDDVSLKTFSDDLNVVFTTAWKDAWDIWKLPSISEPEKADEVWARYDLLEITGTREQALLHDKLGPLGKSFRELLKWLPKLKSKSE